MAVKMVTAFVFVAAVMVATWGGAAEGAVTCQDVVSSMAPCAGYLMGNAPNPAPACCPAVQSLNSRLTAVADRQTACNCFKQAASSYGVSVPKAQSLPRICKVSLNVAVAPNVNCANVH
ncbi:hypothetical protein SUGI_0712900 [Cryptomeria japonica]|uniref:non-specific lipid-transfer protein n=1 Tax=Cryptomeria japonica TaxID=3369 RepID=UPI0024149F96|nr:non-specific lipid-transfer protein [Cryptomeria japonica]GLJ35446.1 hypothetical protein SUGI_0712900 [Cryptomeria japonica]